MFGYGIFVLEDVRNGKGIEVILKYVFVYFCEYYKLKGEKIYFILIK